MFDWHYLKMETIFMNIKNSKASETLQIQTGFNRQTYFERY